MAPEAAAYDPGVPQLAVAVLGPDQPGVIAAVTEVLLAEHGNLSDAAMTLLAGTFAMTLVVDTPAGCDTAERDLRAVAERFGLLISVREAPGARPGPPGSSHLLRLHGADRPGLVHRAAAAVAGHGGNITDLSTRLSGGGLYVLLAALDLPPGAEPALAAQLQALAHELGVEIRLDPVDDDVL